MTVKRETLITIAGIVWFLAGFNVAKIGIEGYMNLQPALLATNTFLLCGMVIVFFVFFMMFSKIKNKNIARIRAFEQERINPFLFMNARGYLIMAIMMGGGFGFRFAGLVPDWFLGFFYTGLGIALAGTGALYLIARLTGSRA